MTGRTSTPAAEARAGTFDVRIATVTGAAAFVSLEERWNDVAASASASSVFNRHEWYSAAWAWRQLDSTLALLTATTEGRLVGILPLIRPAHLRGRARRLELLTVPDTQLADLIVSPQDGPRVAAALAAELARSRDWDTLQLDYLPARGAVVEFLVPALARRGLRVHPDARGGNPHVALAGTWNDYYNARSRSLKKAVNLAANRLHKAGNVRIDWITSENSDPSHFEAALNAVVDLSRRSWKRDTGNALDQAGPQAFIRALSHAAYRRGWGSIWLIYVDERPLAMEYQLVHDGDVHALRADFDADCTDISPGSHLYRHLLEQLFGRGWRRYYLGPGDNPYKRRWTRDEEPMTRITVYNRTWRGGQAWLRDRWMRPTLRAARDLLRRGRENDSEEHAQALRAGRLKP
jgi:CelD/BcsL family acetyltransferase involved in cellulose biosynthesis